MLKKFTLAMLLTGIGTFSTNAAFADGVGWFLQGAAQYGQLDARIEDEDLDFDEAIEAFFDDSSVGFNAGGGYRFNKWLAIDAAYWDLGEFKSDDLDNGDKIKYETTAFTLGGMVSVPLWILDIYGRLGAAYTDVDSRFISDSSTDAYYGAGVALNIGGSFDIYLEYLRLDADDAIDTGSLGVRFTF